MSFLSMSDRPTRVLCCWPGLAGLWLRGHWSSLVLAIGFSIVLNLALLSTFVWPAFIGVQLKWLVWLATGVLWLVCGWKSWNFLSSYDKRPSIPVEKPDETDDTLFIRAQTEYLKGDFTQAESLLAQQLQRNTRDAEARLLLASIYHRTNRTDRALHQLQQLQRLDTADPWSFEIQRQLELVEQDRSESADDLQEDDSLQDEDSTSQTEPSLGGTIRLGEDLVGDGETVHEDKPIHNQQRAA